MRENIYLRLALFTGENKTLLINVLLLRKARGVEVPERMKWGVRMDKIRRLEVRTTKKGYVRGGEELGSVGWKDAKEETSGARLKG